MRNLIEGVVMHTHTLLEGMREGDLEDLVLPMITIDEYASKLDENAIVIGFYVQDRDAAEDLNRFIQKSPVEMLDTEVSPAPDQHGYYICFIELLNDRRIVENIETIMAEVSPLVANTEWQMRLRGLEGVKKFSSKTLDKRFTDLRAKVAAAANDSEGKVMEFLKPSDLHDVVIEDTTIRLVGRAGTITATFEAIGETDVLMSDHNLSESAVCLDFKVVSQGVKIAQILGEHWTATQIGSKTLLQRTESTEALILDHATRRMMNAG